MKRISTRQGIASPLILAILGVLIIGGIAFAVMLKTKSNEPKQEMANDEILEEYLKKQAENPAQPIPLDQDIPINPETAAAVNEKLEGTTMGQGTEFLADSLEGDAPVRIESSEEVGVRINVYEHDRLIEISIRDAKKDSTIFTIYNLTPNKTYYKYVDTLARGEEIKADAQGVIRFEQDTSQRHLIMIMNQPSTYVIEDTPTGGDCSLIGIWDALTKTCTLTRNVDDTIEIAADGITLDGDDFSVTNPMDKNFGVYVGARTGVVIKNLFIGDYLNGVKLFGSANVRVENVFLRDNSRAIDLENADNNVIVRNTVQQSSPINTRQGTFLDMSDNNVVVGNSVIDSRRGFGFIDSSDNGFANNTATNNFNAIFTVNGQGIIERNNFIDNDQDADLTNAGNFIFYDSVREQGNYWSKFDEASEGCVDTDNNKQCDGPYNFLDKTDLYPWICATAWSQDCPQPGAAQSLIKPVNISGGTVECFFPAYMRLDEQGWKHNGIDIIGSSINGKDVIAAAGGTIRRIDRINNSPAGKWVWLHHGNIRKLDGTAVASISTRYLHLDTISTEPDFVEGGSISQGRSIGTVGNTGSSTGPHLHFEVRTEPLSSDLVPTGHLNPHLFVDYPAEENTTICAFLESPVDIIIIDPDGLRLSGTTNEIGTNAQHWLFGYPAGNLDVSADEYQMFIIEDKKFGEYQIQIMPKSGVPDNETFTLIFYADGDRIILAEDMPIASIPSRPYIIESTATGIKLVETKDLGQTKVTICHIPSGNPTNAHEITIGEPAVAAHLNHGDVAGDCNSSAAREAIEDAERKSRNLVRPSKK